MCNLALNLSSVLAFLSPSSPEMLVVLVVALILYGGRLPEVARTWGKSFAEFRRSLTGFQSEFNDVIYGEPERLEYYDDSPREEAAYSEPELSSIEDRPSDEADI